MNNNVFDENSNNTSRPLKFKLDGGNGGGKVVERWEIGVDGMRVWEEVEVLLFPPKWDTVNKVGGVPMIFRVVSHCNFQVQLVSFVKKRKVNNDIKLVASNKKEEEICGTAIVWHRMITEKSKCVCVCVCVDFFPVGRASFYIMWIFFSSFMLLKEATTTCICTKPPTAKVACNVTAGIFNQFSLFKKFYWSYKCGKSKDDRNTHTHTHTHIHVEIHMYT